ncbi:MAG: exopolysaccharide biosynthesis polyprenyl glycosylphosphotransferase [Butyrivibrio sp.]
MKRAKEKRYEVILRIIKIFNVLLITAVFAGCWYIYYAERTYSPYFAKGNYLVVALYALVYFTYGRVYDGFQVQLLRISELVYSQALACGITNCIFYVICWLLTKHLVAVWPLLLVLVCQIALSAIWSLCAHKWYYHVFAAKQTVVIYERYKGLKELLSEYGLDTKFNVIRVLNADEFCKAGTDAISDAEAVFVVGVPSHERNMILKYCVEKDIDAFMVPKIGDLLVSSTKRVHMLHLPILMMRRYNPVFEYVAIKRVFDILISLIAIIILSPVFLITAIAIKAYDGGPVFYKQCRLTKDARKFNILKFRSMRVNAEKDGVARLSTGEKDDRITPVGRVIRKLRIDELPQFINILKGDMSIVGPRPERPEIAAQYEKELPEFSLRLQAKAGLTGSAQVYGKYNTTPADKLKMDLMYISKPSLMEDLRIIFATIKILFMKDSTEGVAEGQTTASYNKQGNCLNMDYPEEKKRNTEKVESHM